jgi:hypothetical protein
MNLHNLYETDKLLVCSISNEKIASLLHLHDLTRVSKQLTKLERYGVVKRIRTGRQNIYVLGEWYDYSEVKIPAASSGAFRAGGHYADIACSASTCPSKEAICFVGGIYPPNPLTRMPFLPTASSGASWHDFVKNAR